MCSIKKEEGVGQLYIPQRTKDAQNTKEYNLLIDWDFEEISCSKHTITQIDNATNLELKLITRFAHLIKAFKRAITDKLQQVATG